MSGYSFAGGRRSRGDKHRTYIRHLERGLSSPSIKTLFLLDDVLETTPSKLLRRVKELLLESNAIAPFRQRRGRQTPSRVTWWLPNAKPLNLADVKLDPRTSHG